MNPCLPIVAALAIRRKTLERVKAARRSRQSIAPGPGVTAPRSRPMELPSDRSPAPGSAAA
jgi:hypothetical protein